jgi:tetratricopeptide (TPR) repeat protein
MNPQILDALHKLVDERAHEMSVDDAILKRFASLPKGSVLPGPPGTPVSECSKRPVTDPIAQAKVCTDILARPDITQMAVLQIMRMRGAARRQGGQFGQSLRDLDKTLRLAQKLTGIESTMMQLHAEFGDTYHYLHQPYSAVRHYDDALNYLYGLGTTDPKIKLDLVRKRAFVYDESHQFSLAVGDYNLLLASIPTDAELWNGRCYAAASDLGANAAALTRALDDCNKALSLKPGAAHIFDSRAFVHMRAGRWEAAITDYTAALAADPKMTSALYGRATAREQTGDTAGRTQDLAAYREQDDWYTTYLELKSRGLFSATKR